MKPRAVAIAESPKGAVEAPLNTQFTASSGGAPSVRHAPVVAGLAACNGLFSVFVASPQFRPRSFRGQPSVRGSEKASTHQRTLALERTTLAGLWHGDDRSLVITAFVLAAAMALIAGRIILHDQAFLGTSQGLSVSTTSLRLN